MATSLSTLISLMLCIVLATICVALNLSSLVSLPVCVPLCLLVSSFVSLSRHAGKRLTSFLRRSLIDIGSPSCRPKQAHVGPNLLVIPPIPFFQVSLLGQNFL